MCVKDDVFATTILQATESGPNVKMEKPSINGGKSIIVQRKREMEVTIHPGSPWHRPVVGIGQKGISAHPWRFCNAMVAAMEALGMSMEAFAVAAMRGTRHVAWFANIRQRR